MYEKHLFICVNGEGDPSRCGGKGGLELHKKVKVACQLPKTRINRSGCLGYCERGIAAVLYPQGRWFLELSQNDAETLKEALNSPLSSDNL